MHSLRNMCNIPESSSLLGRTHRKRAVVFLAGSKSLDTEIVSELENNKNIVFLLCERISKILLAIINSHTGHVSDPSPQYTE